MQISSPTSTAGAAAVLAGPRPTPVHADDRVRLLTHLTPVRRDDGEVQLGVDAEDAVILTDPDGTVTRLLELMDGRCRLGDLRALARQHAIPAERVDDLVAVLAGSGLLQTCDAAGPAAYGVRLIGGGPVATSVGEQLLRAGIGRLLVVDPDGDPWQPPASVDRDRVQRAEHWSQPEIDAVQLSVLVAASLEPDRAITTELTAADHSHLLVRPRPGGAMVGPLVLPGRTSCLRCGDLSRTRTDPAWPRMLAQLCRTRVDWDPVAAAWAAAMTSTQVLAHLAGRTVETAAATVELGPVDWSWQRRVWRADPACGCCWAPRAEW